MFDEKFLARYWAKVVRTGEDDCWMWTGSTAGKGYGYIKLTKSKDHVYAHRASYMIHKGAIPEGLMIMHSCDNPACCNPKHLSLGTYKDNSQDMKVKNRHLCGEKNAKSKLTEEDVKAIKRLYSKHSQYKLAQMFGISQTQIGRILRGERWSHIEDKE